MGGSAFSSAPNPPYTPRMPPMVYRRVLSHCQVALRELFVCVATPIEGPGKIDYGDIDILVALEKRVVFPATEHDSTPRTPPELLAVVQRTLSAKHAIVHGSSANLAIPWPSDMDEHVMTSGESREKYIQVDINICPDMEQLCWVSVLRLGGRGQRVSGIEKYTDVTLLDSLQACSRRPLEPTRKHHPSFWPYSRRGSAVAKDTRD